MTWRCPACLTIYKKIFPQKMGKSKSLNTLGDRNNGKKLFSLCSVGSRDFLTNHLDGPLSKSHMTGNFYELPPFGFWPRYLTARLKRKQRPRTSWWWCGNVSPSLFVAWTPNRWEDHRAVFNRIGHLDGVGLLSFKCSHSLV